MLSKKQRAKRKVKSTYKRRERKRSYLRSYTPSKWEIFISDLQTFIDNFIHKITGGTK